MGPCRHCGKTGHLNRDCTEKPAAPPSTAPKPAKGKGLQAQGHVADTETVTHVDYVDSPAIALSDVDLSTYSSPRIVEITDEPADEHMRGKRLST